MLSELADVTSPHLILQGAEPFANAAQHPIESGPQTRSLHEVVLLLLLCQLFMNSKYANSKELCVLISSYQEK